MSNLSKFALIFSSSPPTFARSTIVSLTFFFAYDEQSEAYWRLYQWR